MKYGWILGAMLVAGLVVVPRWLESCGPFPMELRFTAYHGLPEESDGGKLGVLRPHFYRRDLLLAYRGLAGLPLSPGEAKPEPKPEPLPDGTLRARRKPGPPMPPDSQRAQPWIEARKLIAGAAAIDHVDGDKKVPGEDYEVYYNCLEDAFVNAATTLQKRVAQWGAEDPRTAEWLRGQDQVFQNCSAGPAIPKPLPAGDKLLSADRDYQIAAAEFYAEQYDQAKKDFDNIAASAGSPWHDTARYVAARVCIRQGTMGKDLGRLREAGERLEAIAKDPGAAQWHASAEELLGFVRARTDPEQQLVALGKQLMQANSDDQLERVITDYTSICDHLEMPGSVNPTFTPLNSDVAQWIGLFQSSLPAIDTWRAKRTLPWLIAALEKSQPRDPAARELIAAAHAVKADSPGYDSVTYYGILTQIRAGELDPARAWTDSALAGKAADSTMNLLRGERLLLARDWSEFLRFAPRRPVAEGSDDGYEGPVDDATAKRKPYALDADSVTPLNRAVPLSLWADAAQNSLMPANLQADIAQAAWVRAVILDDRDTARAVAGRLQQLKPELAPEMSAYLAEKDPAAAHFAAVFLMLRAPGLEPVVRAGMGRTTPVMKSDMFRDNWWLLNAPANPLEDNRNHQALYDLYPDGHFGTIEFLPEAQRSAAEKEWQQLTQRAANSVNYLCAATLDWARTHPQDERVPQALHLAVEATHYGPAEKSSSSYSRQAFDLLHRRYPNSEWTKKTKYWY
jgi:hypothetical protein